jgi:hypothetical protein
LTGSPSSDVLPTDVVLAADDGLNIKQVHFPDQNDQSENIKKIQKLEDQTP